MHLPVVSLDYSYSPFAKDFPLAKLRWLSGLLMHVITQLPVKQLTPVRALCFLK